MDIRNINDLSSFQREKIMRCGDYMTVDIYPRSKAQEEYCRSGKRSKIEKVSRPAQRRLNDKNSFKYVNYLANGNFKKGDYFLMYSYDNRFLPKSLEQAKKEFSNFIERVKYELKKVGKEKELKWICVTEFEELNDKGKPTRIHHHVLINNIVDVSLLKEKWSKRVKSNRNNQKTETKPIGIVDVKEIQLTDDSGLDNLVGYKFKFRKEHRSWTASRNLKQPEKVRVRDCEHTRRKMEKLHKSNDEGLAYFEKTFPEYFIKDIFWSVKKYQDFETLSVSFKLLAKGRDDDLLVLSNDSKRKEFLKNYHEWSVVQMDMVNQFKYFRYIFDDGSMITSLEYPTGLKIPRNNFLTLTKSGRQYMPIPSTQSELLAHLKSVVPGK